jgi:hypothetical protein
MIEQAVVRDAQVGEALFAAGLITEGELRVARRESETTGIPLGEALVSLGYANEEQVTAALADHTGLPFVDLRSAPPDPSVARLLSKELEHERGVLPVQERGDTIIVACTDRPEACGLAELEPLIGRPVQPVLVTESAFDEALDRLYRDEYVEHSTSQLVSQSPENSARWVLSGRQKIFGLGYVLTVCFALVAAPMATVILAAALTTIFYVAFSIFKLLLVHRALTGAREIETSSADLAALDDRELPIYTILVPVYRETEVLPILIRAIGQLDYPRAKLDVKILLEEDDHETIAVARASDLPSHFKLVVVPGGTPKGKPRACNYGLIRAQGEYVVIYDAEDIPEPDQLKKAIVAFRKGGDRLACVQAKLNYFNRDQNLLTRWFTTEYSAWFDLLLPGLAASDAPIPLGGTSNHFRAERLRQLGAWDPYNVTEDADLGVRLY